MDSIKLENERIKPTNNDGEVNIDAVFSSQALPKQKQKKKAASKKSKLNL